MYLLFSDGGFGIFERLALCISLTANSHSPKVCNTVQGKLKVQELHNMLPEGAGFILTP